MGGSSPEWMTKLAEQKQAMDAQNNALLLGAPRTNTAGIADPYVQMARAAQIQKILTARGTQSTFLQPGGQLGNAQPKPAPNIIAPRPAGATGPSGTPQATGLG